MGGSHGNQELVREFRFCQDVLIASSEHPEPQRQQRGQERIERILRAALAVIERGGIAAVTQRAVAREAGVPLGSLVYYFPSKLDLLQAALEAFVDEEVSGLRAIADGLEGASFTAEQLADLYAEAITGLAASPVAQFELYLEAARQPTLRESAERAIAAYAGVAEQALRAAGAPDPAGSAGLFVALVDGIGLHEGVAPGSVPDLREALLALFRAVGAGS
jgi:DNA-binding transcriptional regulator YbjK